MAEANPGCNYTNLARSSAGNEYICDSTIKFLENANLDPSTTLVMIMWSGTGRKDLQISGEWWYHIKQTYGLGHQIQDETYYLFSGGLYNSWTTNGTIKKIFEWPYKLSDPSVLCQHSLMQFINLENYLKVHGYHYRFLIYTDCLSPAYESNWLNGDYNIGYFCKDRALYKNYQFSNWIFLNQNMDCLAEFARNSQQLNSTQHPTALAHKEFAHQVVLPAIELLLTQ